MPSRLLLMICVVTGGVLSASSALAAPVVACKLLTAAEVGAIVGASVAQATSFNGPTSSSCKWKGGGVVVIVATISADTFQSGRRRPLTTPVNGVGDEAYQTGFAPTVTTLSARKGSNAISVSVRGLKDLSALETAEQAVGRAAAGRL